MRKYELTPTDGRKSFYGEAVVIVADNGTETLYSYGTPLLKGLFPGNWSSYGTIGQPRQADTLKRFAD